MSGSTAVIAMLLLACMALGSSPSSAPTPPLAKKIPHETQLHGDTLVDPYFWMRQKDNPDVLAYLKAENAYTDAILKPTEALREKLYHEMVARIREDDQD